MWNEISNEPLITSTLYLVIFDKYMRQILAKLIIEANDNGKDPIYFYLNILIIFVISMVYSLLFYVIYICVFEKKGESIFPYTC